MKDQKGQILVFALLFIPVLILLIALTLGIGKMVYLRIKLQNAADAAVYTAANWQARGLNVISDLNWALAAACGGDILKNGGLPVNFQLTKAVQAAQVAAQQSFSGTSALAAVKNFNENSGGGICLPFPPDVVKMFSLKVRRKKYKIAGFPVELWMEKDTPKYWIKQEVNGPFIRMTGRNSESELVFGGKMLGINIPAMYVIAQAMPVRSGDKYTGSVEYMGGLWDPSFYAKLSPVNINIPGVNELILH